MEARPPSAKPAKLFECEYPGCEKTFSRKSNMRAHARVHTGETPYSCPYCNKRFKWRSCQSSHEKIHIQPPTADELAPDAYEAIDAGPAFESVQYERSYQGQGEAAYWDSNVGFGQGQGHGQHHQNHQHQQHQQNQHQNQHHQPHQQPRQPHQSHQPHQPLQQQGRPQAFPYPSRDPPAQQTWYPMRDEHPQRTDHQQAPYASRSAPHAFETQLRHEPPNSSYFSEQLQQSSMASARAQAAHARSQSFDMRRAEMAAGVKAQEAVRARAKSGPSARSLASTEDDMRTETFEEQMQEERQSGKPVPARPPTDSLNDTLDAFYDRSFLPYQRLGTKPEEALYTGDGDGFEVSPASVTGSTRGESGGKSTFCDADRDADHVKTSMNGRGGGKVGELASLSLAHVGSGFPAVSPINAGPFSSSRLPLGADGSPLKNATLVLGSDEAALGPSEGHSSPVEHLKLDGSIPIDEF